MVPTGASLEAARARSGIEFQGKTMAATFETLLASDFSARCDRPLDRATQIQRDHGGTLTIAHVLKRDGPQSGPEPVARLRAELPPAAQNAGTRNGVGEGQGVAGWVDS